jgi:hypothetical protein
MTYDYFIVGGVLIIMGGTQIWVRRHDLADERHKAAERAAAERASEEGAGEPGVDGPAEEPPAEEPRRWYQRPSDDSRKPPLWDAWTGILGYLAILFGIAVLVVGLLGL